MLDRRECVAIISAAGQSSRMGQVKALLPWAGHPLVRYQCHQLEGFAQIITVLGAHAERIQAEANLPAHIKVVTNQNWARGRSSSLACAARAATPRPHGAILIAAVDQPLEAAVVDLLLANFDARRDEALIPTYGPRRGHPLLLSSRLHDALTELESPAYPQGLRSLVRDPLRRVRELPTQSPRVLADLNTPADYRRAHSEAQS